MLSTGAMIAFSPQPQRVAIGLDDLDLLPAAPRSASRTPPLLRRDDSVLRGSPPLLFLGQAPAEGTCPDNFVVLGPQQLELQKTRLRWGCADCRLAYAFTVAQALHLRS